VKGFTVEAFVDGNWKEITKGTTIGYKRILRFPGSRRTKVRFNDHRLEGSPVISSIGLYNAPADSRRAAHHPQPEGRNLHCLR
jgi:alpha-L-fucosidase